MRLFERLKTLIVHINQHMETEVLKWALSYAPLKSQTAASLGFHRGGCENLLCKPFSFENCMKLGKNWTKRGRVLRALYLIDTPLSKLQTGFESGISFLVTN